MKLQSSLTRFLPLVVLTSSLSGVAIAQDREKESDRKYALRILAVGEAPPWDERTINNVRVQQDPPPGSVPPYQVQMVNKEGAEEGDAINIRLDQISAVAAVRGGLVPLHETGEGGLSSKPWHSVKYPSGAPAALAILWRDPTVKKWDKALSLTIRDDVTYFGEGRLRIVNVSGVDVGLDIDGKKGKLPSGKVLLQATKAGKAHVKINVKTSQGWTEVADRAIQQAARERTNMVIYRADGEAPRRPLKAVVLREAARTPVVPKRR